MTKGDYPGAFESLVLAALLRLGDEAYGVTIRRELEERTGRNVAIGAVHATLARMEDKGYVHFSLSDPRPIQGGKARKYARLTPRGRRALEETLSAMTRMVDGLKLDTSR